MFDNQLLGHVLEVPFAHPLESIPNLFLYELLHFGNRTLVILDPMFVCTPVDSSFQNLRWGNSQIWPGIRFEESGQER